MKLYHIGTALILASVFSVGQLQYFIDSMVKVGTKNYFINSLFKANNYAASEFCRFNGLQLASFEDQDQLDAVGNRIKTLNILEKPAHFWTSGSDQGHEGKFIWLATGFPVNISAWVTGQPDSRWDTEDCLELDTTAFKLNDANCTGEAFFICQYVEGNCRPFENICKLF